MSTGASLIRRNGDSNKGTIANYLKQNGVTMEKYVRIEVGQ